MKKILYTLLAILLVIFSCIFLTTTPNEEWLSSLSGNLFAEIFGIFFTVAIIDRIIEANQEKTRRKFNQIAFQQLRIPLIHHFQLLFNMYKASVISKPSKIYANISDIFDDNYFDEIAFLDFLKPAPVIPEVLWINYLGFQFKEFKESLEKTIEKYSIYLQSDVIDLIEQLSNSNFVSFTKQVVLLPIIDKEQGFERDYNFLEDQSMRDMVREHVNLFIILVEKHNQFAREESLKINITDELWRNDVSPQIGGSRFSRNVI